MTPNEPWVGQVLKQRYRILRPLGQGGMGAVYLSHDADLDREVVVKIPHAHYLADSGFVARFQTEIRSLIELEHSHIVGILDAGEHDGIPFFVLQYLVGGSLKQHLTRPLSLPEILPWFRDIASALDFIHAEGTIHRDLKPDNILLDRTGAVFVADFGIAKILNSETTGQVTLTDKVSGTLSYLAPEAALEVTPGPAYDQYALAVMVYQALSGHVPYEATSLIKLLKKWDSEKPQSLLGKVEAVTPRVEKSLFRALETDPEKRYRNCTEFIEALASAAAPQQGRRGRDRWVWISAAAIAITATVYGVLAYRGGAGASDLGVAVLSPADGIMLNADSVSVSGTVEGTGIEVVSAILDESEPVDIPVEEGRFEYQLALPPGPESDHSLVVTARGRVVHEARISIDRRAPEAVEQPKILGRLPHDADSGDFLVRVDYGETVSIRLTPGADATDWKVVAGGEGEIRLSTQSQSGHPETVRIPFWVSDTLGNVAEDGVQVEVYSGALRETLLEQQGAETLRRLQALSLEEQVEEADEWLRKVENDELVDEPVRRRVAAHVRGELQLDRIRGLLVEGFKLLDHASPRASYTHKKSSLKFVRLPGARVTLVGSPTSELGRTELEDQYSDEVKPLLVCVTECTEAAWAEVMEIPAPDDAVGMLPKTSVSWNDVQIFLDKSKLQLPTEIEWEYCCRAGRTGLPSEGERLAEGWVTENSGGELHATAARSPNPWDLFDMIGNVYEWCENPCGPYGQAPAGTRQRAIRGGSFVVGLQDARPASRAQREPEVTDYDLGFRPVFRLR